MMRKLAITLLLLAGGFLVLHLTIGFENFTRSGGGGGTPPLLEGGTGEGAGAATDDGTGQDRESGRGVVVGEIEGGEGQAAISVTGRGATRFRRDEEHPMPDGSVRYVPLWILDAKDSETVDEDLIRLFDVTLLLHRIDQDGPDAVPTATPIGTVTALEALVSVGRDEDGRPSIDQDREMDLFGVGLQSERTIDGPVRDISLQVARLRVRQSDTGLAFRTPSPVEPFELNLGGDDPMTVTGQGIEGSVPGRGLDGELEFRVLSAPTVVRGASSLRADGELTYREDARSGYGRLTMQDRVRLLGVSLDPGRAASTATGDRLEGVLVRYQNDAVERTSHGAAWRNLRLTGRPARLSQLTENGEGPALEVLSSTLDVRPDTAGEPWLFTAEGTPVVIDGRSGARFEAAERIHVIDPRRLIGGVHRYWGFQPGLPALVGSLLLFEGASRIVDASQGLEVTAEDGLRILRGRSDADTGSELSDAPLLAFGQGAVHIVREDLDVTGSDGFELHLDGDRNWLRLGPDFPDVDHRYVLRRSTDEGEVTLEGSGRCEVDGAADGSAVVDLWSPDDSVRLRSADGEVRAVGSLHAELDPDGRPSLVDARGARCALDAVLRPGDGKEDQPISGVASRITMRGARLELDGGTQGAVLVRRQDRVEGSRITLDRLDRESGVVHVEDFADGRRALVHARIPARDPDALDELAELTARDLRALPQLIPSRVLAAHGIPVFGASLLRSEAVLARGDAVVQRFDPGGREVGRAEGDLLLFLPMLERGVLFGDDAVVSSRDPQGRRSIGRAPEIRVAIGPAGLSELSFELRPAGRSLPEVDVFGADDSDSDDAFKNARIICDGVIRNTGDLLSLDGPVQVRGLTDAGAIDPQGVEMSAARLDLEWDPQGRRIRRVLASRGASFRFREFAASGERVMLDASRSTASVESGSTRPARIELGGQLLTGAWFEANYRTLEYRAFAVRLGDAAAAAGPGR